MKRILNKADYGREIIKGLYDDIHSSEFPNYNLDDIADWAMANIDIILFTPEMLQTCKSLNVINIGSDLNISPYLLSIKKSKYELPEDEFYDEELDTQYELSKVDEEDEEAGAADSEVD